MYRYTEIIITFSRIPDIMHFLQKKAKGGVWDGREGFMTEL